VLDTSAPNLARAYDYLLGGRANFAADRSLAERLKELYPAAGDLLFKSRAYQAASLQTLAQQGVAQYVDVGSGLPTSPAAHGVVRRIVPGARIAYVDRDPTVVQHIASLVPPGVRAFEGDLAEPEAILDTLGTFVDFTKPVCLILAMVLQVLEPDTARAVAGVLIRALSPGSYVLITAGAGERGRLPDAVSPGGFGPEDIAGFLAGLELLPPGLSRDIVLCATGCVLPRV
jgi:S-adenosyl methyltransferase